MKSLLLLLSLSVLLPTVKAQPQASSSTASESEPLYFIYHGNHRTLRLDSTQIAVSSREFEADTLPEGLARNGFTLRDVTARSLRGTRLLDTRKVLNAHATQSTPAAVHALIRALANSGDRSIEFVSPVFRDEAGDPMLITSRILIGFEEDIAPAEREYLRRAVTEGASLETAEFPQPHDFRWQINTRDGFAALARANALAETPGVKYAEPDMVVTGHTSLLPSDPSFSQSWGLKNSGQFGGLVGFDMGAISAWDATTGAPSVIVLVMDSGVQQDHPDINQIPGRDFTSDAPSNPTGGPIGVYDNHGTTVAGCVSARINNSLGTSGIAPGVKVASARCGTNYTSSGTFSAALSWFANALYWGESLGARVSNRHGSYRTYFIAPVRPKLFSVLGTEKQRPIRRFGWIRHGRYIGLGRDDWSAFGDCACNGQWCATGPSRYQPDPW